MSKEEVIVQRTWTELIHIVFDILNFPLFDLDGHPVSLGKLVTGMFLLMFSYLVSKRAAKEVDRRLLLRMSMDDSLRYTLQRLLFYFFVFISTLFTLHALAVPITIFTVIGGALAVGVGFGSQNLVNNFISGILVMVERPMRVGDFIEVDGVIGQVEQVGIRTTELRAANNSLMVIPNTVFIEQKLTNWSASERVGATVRVGVAYGTDLELATQLCLQAVGDQAQVMENPPPNVLLADFADSALNLDIAYSIPAREFPNRGVIASAIRFRLNELFAQNRIEIPFPQRQVHILNPPGASHLESRAIAKP